MKILILKINLTVSNMIRLKVMWALFNGKTTCKNTGKYQVRILSPTNSRCLICIIRRWRLFQMHRSYSLLCRSICTKKRQATAGLSRCTVTKLSFGRIERGLCSYLTPYLSIKSVNNSQKCLKQPNL